MLWNQPAKGFALYLKFKFDHIAEKSHLPAAKN